MVPSSPSRELPDPVPITDIYRLIYTSEAGAPEDAAERRNGHVYAIGRRAVARNAQRNLSGVLIYVRGIFIQVLEGCPADIEETFERICCDMRHSALSLIDYSATSQRQFGAWEMKAIDAAQTKDPELFEDLVMSIRGGMGPTAIIQEITALLEEAALGQPHRKEAG